MGWLVDWLMDRFLAETRFRTMKRMDNKPPTSCPRDVDRLMKRDNLVVGPHRITYLNQHFSTANETSTMAITNAFVQTRGADQAWESLNGLMPVEFPLETRWKWRGEKRRAQSQCFEDPMGFLINFQRENELSASDDMDTNILGKQVSCLVFNHRDKQPTVCTW